ncbi:MAG: TIGR00725 family protein [Candidatus Omnitrophota bacterium]
MSRKFLVSVIGGYECDENNAKLAEQVGEVISQEGFVLVCGGKTGIMEAACKGAKKAGGLTIGIIPGEDKREANEFVDVVIATGMGYSRNALVAGTADLVVAFPGKYGTLSEIGFALNAKKEVYGFGTWDIPGVEKLESPEELRGILKKRVKG